MTKPQARRRILGPGSETKLDELLSKPRLDPAFLRFFFAKKEEMTQTCGWLENDPQIHRRSTEKKRKMIGISPISAIFYGSS